MMNEASSPSPPDSCSGACRRAVYPFSFSSQSYECDVHRGSWGDFSVEKLIVLTREEEDPIVDLQIDERSVLSCLRIEPERTTQRVDEKGVRWLTKVWAPSNADSMVMRSRLRIRSRDLAASHPTETWARAAVIGSHSGSCRCERSRAEEALASRPIDYEAWKVREMAQAIVCGFRPGGMDQRDYEAWRTQGITQSIAAGFWPWDRRPHPQDRDLIYLDRSGDPIAIVDDLTQAECRIRWWQNRRDVESGIPPTFALTLAQVAAAKSSLGLCGQLIQLIPSDLWSWSGE